MPRFAHQFADYLGAFEELGLRVRRCLEWSPNDVGNPVPLQALKRGASTPITVEFVVEQLS
jgi:hypothetical protein